MTAMVSDRALRSRLGAALVLGLCALILTGAEILQDRGRASATGNSPSGHVPDVALAASIDTLLVHYGIDRSSARLWRAKAGGAPTGRVEEQFHVGGSFLSLEFNHELNTSLAPLGAHVVATERTKEHTVTMHIVWGGKTIRSLSFVLDTQH